MSSTLLQLPFDILIKVIRKLHIVDLRNLMLTCKTFRNLILKDNTVWRSLYRDKLILQNGLENSRFLPTSWYNLCRISHNWCHGIYRNKIILQHHTNYMPWLKFLKSQALLLSVGSELQCFPTDKKGIPDCKQILWRLEVPQVKRYDVRTNDISRFIVNDNFIVCGNRDGCVAVYELNDIRQRPRLLYHIQDCHENGQMEVTAVELISNKEMTCVFSASNCSSLLHLWHCKTEANNQNIDFKYYQDPDSVEDLRLPDNVGLRCLAVNQSKDKLAIGLNGNSKPLLLDVTTRKLLLRADKTKNNKQAVRDIQWHSDNTVVYVTHSGALQLIDIRTNKVVYEAMDPFQSSLYCVKTDSGHAIIVGSSQYSRCVLFDSRNYLRHVQMYFTQKKSSPIYSLDFDSTKLIAAADRSIAALNFNVSVATAQLRDYSHAFEIVNR